MPAPTACAPIVCVGFPLGIGDGLSIRPEIEIISAGGVSTLIANYGRSASIRLTARRVATSRCETADGQWRKVGQHRFETQINLPPARFRPEPECRYLVVETAGLPEPFEQSLAIDIWQMTDYFPGSAGDFVEQPVEQWARLFLRDIE